MALKAQPPTPKRYIWPSDMQALWRLGFWGCSAAVALAAATVVLRSDIGAQRLQVAIASVRDSTPPALPAVAQLIPRNFEAESETRRLSEAVHILTSDRDRLLTRIAGLERNLDDITGSIKAAPAQASAPAAPPAPAPLPVQTSAPAAPPAPLPPPAPHVATIAPLLPNFPPAVPDEGATATWPNAPAAPAASRSEFGVDIGGAASVEALRAQWAAAKRRHGLLFEGMQPLVSTRESKPGLPELRLIVGPLSDAVAATKLCAALSAARASCRTAAFEGQRLPRQLGLAPTKLPRTRWW
jgi:hypothetical protein